MSSNQSTEVYDFMRWCLYGKRHQFFSADFFHHAYKPTTTILVKNLVFVQRFTFFLSSSRKRFINHWILKMNHVHPFFLSIFFHSLFLVYLTFRYLLFYFSFSLFIHFVILIFLPLSLLFYFVLSAPSPPLFFSL